MSELDALNQQLKDAKELVQRRDNALQLGKLPLFRTMILEEYMVTEAARLVGQSADPNLGPAERADALAMAQATGHLKRYLSMMVVMGNTAEREISQIEKAIEEVRMEGDDE